MIISEGSINVCVYCFCCFPLDCPLWGFNKEAKYANCRFYGGNRKAGLHSTDTAMNQPIQIQTVKIQFSLADLGSRPNQPEELKMLGADVKL